MTETTQDLLARLAGFTPGPWGFEKADDECYGYSFWSSDGTNICEFGGEYDNGDQVRGQHPQKYDAALIAAAPDLHRIATEQAAEIARLREAIVPLLKFASKYSGSSEHLRMLSRARAALQVQP